MEIAEWRTLSARLMLLGALVCGIIGLVVGVVDRTWKLGITGWLAGGTLLAAMAIALLADEYLETRRRGQR